MKFERVCPTCGKQIQYDNKYNLKRAIEVNSGCRPCVRSNLNRLQPRKKENNAAWKGYKDVGYKWFSKYFERSNKKRTGTITIQDAYNKLKEQNFKCALTNIDLPWSEDSGMSIDRIDSSKEYVINNIQIVHKDVNLMKNHFDQDYFIEICHKVTTLHKR